MKNLIGIGPQSALLMCITFSLLSPGIVFSQDMIGTLAGHEFLGKMTIENKSSLDSDVRRFSASSGSGVARFVSPWTSVP